MRWTSTGLGAIVALSGAASGSYVSGLLAQLAQRRQNDSSPSADAPYGLNNDQGAGGRGGLVLLEPRQAGGLCGADNGGAKCPANQCCSQWGYCGTGAEYCLLQVLCQTEYGSCAGRLSSTAAPTSSAAPPRPPPPVTTTTRPTTTSAPPVFIPPTPSSRSTPIVIIPTTTPRPTSSYTPPAPPASSSSAAPPPPTGPRLVSTNGMCGNTTTCAGSVFGRCCSQFFYCGSGPEFCGDGCQSQFGSCGSAPRPISPTSSIRSSSSSTIAPPASTSTTFAPPPPRPPPPTTTSSSTVAPRPTTSTSSAAPRVSLPPGLRSSTDGTCGNGVSCTGARFGRCCSQFGYCGDGELYCAYITQCQPQFGYCDPAPPGASTGTS